MGARRVRRQQRQTDMAKSRRVNGMLKTKERARRDERLSSSILEPDPARLDVNRSGAVRINRERVGAPKIDGG